MMYKKTIGHIKKPSDEKRSMKSSIKLSENVSFLKNDIGREEKR